MLNQQKLTWGPVDQDTRKVGQKDHVNELEKYQVPSYAHIQPATCWEKKSIRAVTGEGTVHICIKSICKKNWYHKYILVLIQFKIYCTSAYFLRLFVSLMYQCRSFRYKAASFEKITVTALLSLFLKVYWHLSNSLSSHIHMYTKVLSCLSCLIFVTHLILCTLSISVIKKQGCWIIIWISGKGMLLMFVFKTL